MLSPRVPSVLSSSHGFGRALEQPPASYWSDGWHLSSSYNVIFSLRMTNWYNRWLWSGAHRDWASIHSTELWYRRCSSGCSSGGASHWTHDQISASPQWALKAWDSKPCATIWCVLSARPSPPAIIKLNKILENILYINIETV